MSLLLLLKNRAAAPYGQATLFLPACDAASGSASLCVAGHGACDSQANLYAGGLGHAASPATLYAGGKDASAGGGELYCFGVGGSSRALGLYAAGRDARVSAVPLAAFGGGRSAAGLPLAVGGLDAGVGAATLFASGPPAAAHPPLFLMGASLDSTVRNVNLWLRGVAPSLGGTSTLYLANYLRGAGGGADLFLRVDGTLVGGRALSEDMALFLQRVGREYALDLYLAGPGTPSGSALGLAVRGGLAAAAASDLSVPGVVCPAGAAAGLYANGW